MVVLYGVLNLATYGSEGFLNLSLFLKKKSSPEKRETLRKPSGLFSFFWCICLSSVWWLTLTHAHFCAISRLTTCLFLWPFLTARFPKYFYFSNKTVRSLRLGGFPFAVTVSRDRCSRDASWTDGRMNGWIFKMGRGVRGIGRAATGMRNLWFLRVSPCLYYHM